ncbi:hypothetical protein [Rhodoplanes azumiensis]|uniref:Membrane protein involved in the export of O-antigen and teichoic acid n=1 Tax=Rhodoplanes azumiensis TaxID=1897628 RepID=A0ABW5AN61_9BRAD
MTRAANVALLLTGFVAGQGSIFAAQTWLAAVGDLDLLAGFGTHYSFAILAIILVDGGAATILARHVAASVAGRQTDDQVWRLFFETTAFRLVMAAIVITCALVYVAAFAPSTFSRDFVLLALPGLAIWTANPIGLLDGRGASGLSGVTGAAAYTACGLGLVVAHAAPPALAGGIVGTAFSLGYVVTVTVQWLVLARHGVVPRWHGLSRAGLGRAFRDGIAMQLQFLPSQAPARVQLLLSAAYLGADTTALFVYVKQIVTGLALIVSFVLRAEFPGLVRTMLRPQAAPVRAAVTAQILTLSSAVGLTLLAAAAAVVLDVVPQLGRLGTVAWVLLAFAPTLLTAYLPILLSQGLAARGSFVGIAVAATVGAAANVATSWLLVGAWGILAFLAGEILSHAVALAIVVGLLKGSATSATSATAGCAANSVDAAGPARA